MQHSCSMDKGKTIQKNKSILQPASLVSLVLYNGLISFQMRKRKKIKQSVNAITTPKNDLSDARIINLNAYNIYIYTVTLFTDSHTFL